MSTKKTNNFNELLVKGVLGMFFDTRMSDTLLITG